MLKLSKRFILFSLFLLMTFLAVGFTSAQDYFDLSINDCVSTWDNKDFCYQTVLITLNEEVSVSYEISANGKLHLIQFDVNDFPVHLKAVRCITPGIYQAQSELSNFVLGTRILTHNYRETSMLNGFRRILKLTLAEYGRDNVLSAISTLRARFPSATSVNPDFIYKVCSVSRCKMSGNDFQPLNNHDWAFDRIGASNFNSSLLSNFVLVGILDSGIDSTHPHLANIVRPDLARCFVDEVENITNPITQRKYNAHEDLAPCSHGTGVAGVIRGVIGSTQNINLVSLRVFGFNGNWDNPSIAGRTSRLIKAIEHATAPKTFIPVLNYSGGGQISQIYVNQLLVAIQNFGNAGGLLIIAAGNGSHNIDNINLYPARLNLGNIITVGSSDYNSRRVISDNTNAITNTKFTWGSNFSSTRRYVHVFAPGHNIRTTTRGGGFCNNFEMTSFSTPMVAATAAILLSISPQLATGQIRSLILNSTDKNICNTILQNSSSGILSVDVAVWLLTSNFRFSGNLGTMHIDQTRTISATTNPSTPLWGQVVWDVSDILYTTSGANNQYLTFTPLRVGDILIQATYNGITISVHIRVVRFIVHPYTKFQFEVH